MGAPLPAPRVVYVVSLFPCWSETFIVREIQELLRLGVDVRIVSLKHASETLVQSDAQALLGRVIYPPRGGVLVRAWLRAALGQPLHSLRELLTLVFGLARHPVSLGKSLVVWARTLALLPRLRALAPAHVHAHWATYPSTAALWMSGRIGVPFSFTAHAHDIFLEDHLLVDKLRAAAFGVTISEFNRRYLAEKVTPMAWQRMRIVRCGVSPAQYEFRPEGRLRGRVLAVGRLDAIKGFEHLIDACSMLQRRGIGFECHIIGEGPLREALQARIDGLGLGQQVQLLGACPQEQVREALYASSVFVLPSVVTPQGDRDGIPVALMEAMACGVPVVSTRVSGIPELVEHGIGGLLAHPADAADLVRCIESLLAAPELGRRLAYAARRKVERDFDVAQEARKLHAAFV
ncbi:MAG: glycosyltransferase [Rubrivivax sp.]|nr:glycosyltransferase [Rubrivivax sp.]